MSLKSPYGDYTDTLGLRNSHDKTFPIGIAYSSRVFVCDNLAFMGDHVIRRKHTAKAKRELTKRASRGIEECWQSSTFFFCHDRSHGKSPSTEP